MYFHRNTVRPRSCVIAFFVLGIIVAAVIGGRAAVSGPLDALPFDDDTIAIQMKTGKKNAPARVGAGFGHLPTDQVTVTVDLHPHGTLEFKGDTFVEDKPGMMLWNGPQRAARIQTWKGEGLAANANRPTHAVRFGAAFEPKKKGKAAIPDRGAGRASVAEIDVDADVLGLKGDNTARAPIFSKDEDDLEARTGFLLPVLLAPMPNQPGVVPLPDELPANSGAKDIAVRLTTAWLSQDGEAGKEIGQYRVSYPNGVRIYDDNGNAMPNNEWLAVKDNDPDVRSWHILTNGDFQQLGFLRADFRWKDDIRQAGVGGNASGASDTNGPFGSQDWIRLVPRSGELVFIRQDNSEIPIDGAGNNDACLMVSKRITTDNLPASATFDGPPGSATDIDTFRLELRGFPPALNPPPQVRVDFVRNGASIVESRLFDTVSGVHNGMNVYRINKHVRPVSTGADADGDPDKTNGHTPRVRLADRAFARALYSTADGQGGGVQNSLPVARPPAEDGTNAIRTADVRFVFLDTGDDAVKNVAIAKTVQWLSDVWAQAGVRFNLVVGANGEPYRIVKPVKNLLTVRRTANGVAGTVSVTVTDPAANPPTTATVTTAFDANDSDIQIAKKLAAAISAKDGFKATAYENREVADNPGDVVFSGALVLVNKGRDVTFSDLEQMPIVQPPFVLVPILDVQAGNPDEPMKGIERASVSLNFMDDDASTIDVFVTGLAAPANDLSGIAGGLANNGVVDYFHNVAFVVAEGVQPLPGGNDGGARPTVKAFVLAHELGHVLLNGDNDEHDGVPATNLMHVPISRDDDVLASKRLSESQHNQARDQNGPGKAPAALLKQK